MYFILIGEKIEMLCKLLMCILFLFLGINILSNYNKNQIIKVEIISKEGIKSYYIHFSTEKNKETFRIFDILE